MPRLLLPALALTLSSTFAPALCGTPSENAGMMPEERICGSITYDVDGYFTDENMIVPDLKYTFASIQEKNDRVSLVELDVITPHHTNEYLIHGENGTKTSPMDLADTEYISSVTCYADDVGVVYLVFDTNVPGKYVVGGSLTTTPNADLIYKAPDGHKLGGIRGNLGKGGITGLQLLWVSI